MEHVICFRVTRSACLIFVGKSQRKKQVPKLFVDARIILKWISKTRM
jgi:hypothetical protein